MPAYSDLVHDSTSSTGASTLTLAAVSGRRSFNTAFGTGGTNVFDYFISHRTAAEWERGTGHLSAATTLVRDTVLASSNAGAAVAFSAGIKDVTNDQPAGLRVDDTLTLTAGAGLTGGGDLTANRTFDVGAGTGITVNANDVALTVPVAVINGGTGAITAPLALTSLGAVAKVGDTITGMLKISKSVPDATVLPLLTIAGGYGGYTAVPSIDWTVNDNGVGACRIGMDIDVSTNSDLVFYTSSNFSVAGTEKMRLGGSGALTLATPLAVASGGTGSSTAATALTALGALPLAGGTMTGVQYSVGSAGAIAANNGTVPVSYQVRSAGTASDAAFMTFHRLGFFAGHFGIDADNNWKVGGWSHGANAYKLWHEGNLTPGNLIGAIRVQKFVASGTYTPHANMLYCIIESVGGGGGGGGVNGGSGYVTGGGGGAGGNYSMAVKSKSEIGASQTVTIGALGAASIAQNAPGGTGGNTSAGTLVVANGGGGGGGGGTGQIGTGGAPGAAGTGDLQFLGKYGAHQVFTSNYAAAAWAFSLAWGGDSRFGFGGRPGIASGGAASDGTGGSGYGAGGGGAISVSVAAFGSGGAGTAGLVLITEFCSA